MSKIAVPRFEECGTSQRDTEDRQNTYRYDKYRSPSPQYHLLSIGKYNFAFSLSGQHVSCESPHLQSKFFYYYVCAFVILLQ